MLRNHYKDKIKIYRKTGETVDDGGIPVYNQVIQLEIHGFLEAKSIENKIINDKKTVNVTHRLICDVYDITENDVAEINSKTYEILTVENVLNKYLQIDLLETA